MNASIFRLDPVNAKLMGVCAGLANATGIDATIVRVATILTTIMVLGPIGPVAYLAAAWLAPKG